MKMQIKLIALVLCSGLYLSGCSKNNPDGLQSTTETTITSIYPNKAKGGEIVTVFGKNLLKDTSGLKVLINNIRAQILLSSNDSFRVRVPQRTGSGSVQVIAGNKIYDGPELTYDYIVVVTTVAGNGSQGSADGDASSSSFKFPFGITVDNNGDLYIADCYNRLIRKIDTVSKTVSTINIPLYSNGGPLFSSPYNLTIDTISKSLYVTDFNRHLLKIKATGDMSVILNDSMVLAGIGLAPDKNLYLSNNTTGQLIRVDTNGQNRTIFASGLITPLNIFFDKDGGMFVTGAAIYKIAYNGTYTQAIPPPTQFSGWEATLGHNGLFYETDNNNHFIRRINKDGTRTIIAGNGIASDIDGVGLNASFNSPIGIASDKDGNLYVSTYNFNNGSGNKIRKVSFY